MSLYDDFDSREIVKVHDPECPQYLFECSCVEHRCNCSGPMRGAL